MKKIFRKEFVIGISVAIALLILFLGIDYLKGINVFKASNFYYVSYTNVNGLAVSAPVNASGFKVGMVRSIEYEFENPGHVLVEISLDNALKVPKGTKAVVVQDILGTATINLQMPESSDYLPVGERLEGIVQAGMLDNVSKDLMPSVAAMMPKIDSLLSAVTALVADPALSQSVKRLDRISANLETTTELLARSMKTLPTVMKNVESISGNTTQLTAELNSFVNELNQAPIDSVISNINCATGELNAILGQLQSRDSSLGLLMHDPVLYQNLTNASASLDSLLIDVKRNPKRYISIKVF